MKADTGKRIPERAGGLAEISDFTFEPASVGGEIIVGFTMFGLPMRTHCTRAAAARALESLTRAIHESLAALPNPQSAIA